MVFYCDHFVLPLPVEHRFPMEKYRVLRERLLCTRVVAAEDLRVPEPATDRQLMRVHDGGYVARAQHGGLSPSEVRRIGFPWCPELPERSRRSVGGTIGACVAALRGGIGVNLAGGTHHAFRDRGEGYCVFNDAAVSARAMQRELGVGCVTILDCDVHQGNGTAAIFADDESVYTFSIHGRNNYPFHKERSDLDVALDDGAGDEEYLEALRRGLDSALAATPDLAIYLAGADPYRGDRLGRLELTKAGLRERDETVLSACRSLGVPVAVVMAGGYSPRVEDIVDIHANTVAVACAGERGADAIL